MILKSLSIEQLQRKARELAALLQPADVITLSGEVGAGKTTFARALIETLSATPVQVTSPTFNLMQSYEVRLTGEIDETLWHLDLYRLKDVQELYALGLDDIWPHVSIIEWPEIAERIVPSSRLNIHFTTDSASTRSLCLQGNEAWLSRIETVR